MIWRYVSSAQIKLWSVALFAMGALTAGVGWQVVHDRATVIESSEFASQQLALNLEAYVSGTLRAADFVADNVGVRELNVLDQLRQSEEVTVERWKDMLVKRPFLRAIALLRPDGSVDRSVVRRKDGGFQVARNSSNLRGWSGFTAHQSGAADVVHVSDPIRGIVADRWVVPVTRAIRGSGGELLGVVYVDIALDTFLDLFSEVLPLGNNSVALYTLDGRLLFSQPFVEGLIGDSFAHVDLFKSRLLEESVGVYEATDPINEDRGVFSYRILNGWPLVLAVDLSYSEILAAWRQRAFFFGLAGLGACIVIFVLTLWLSLQFGRDEENRKTLMFRERSLEESQRLAGVGHFERDILTGEITWAENMYVIHGVTAETFDPGRTSFFGLVVDEARDVIAERVHQFDVPPTNGNLECKILRPSDGAVRDMIYAWEVIRDQHDVPVKTFGVAQDVTDLRTSEDKVRDNEARLRDIMECMSDFVWETDATGTIIYFETGSNTFSLDIEVGVTRDEHIDAREGEGDVASMVQAIRHHESFRNLNIPLKDKKNEIRWVRVSGNPKFNQNGGCVGFRGAGADVTELRQQRILKSEKSKTDALDRLAGGIAHEINNLLQPVIVYSAMGETEIPETARTQGYFKKIYTASQQAKRIVLDILTFAREGRTRPQPVSLSAIVEEGLDIMRSTLPPALKLLTPVQMPKLNVSANSGGLHQVLFNLVGNAADAAGPNGEVSVDIGSAVLYPRDADRWDILPGRYGYVSVTDDGAGIDEQTINKVFDPFFTTKPRGVGTGLGLSVVAGLVREWGGAVDVKSKAGETVFTVYVPMVEAERQAAE